MRWIYLAYGVSCYVLFLVAYVCLAGFLGNFAGPWGIDRAAQGSLGAAVAVDLVLLLAFAAQHSVMARPAFKRFWTQWIPAPIERSTYMLASCLVLFLCMACWQPLDLVIWDLRGALARASAWSLFAAGWILVPVVSLAIHHFDLFGLRQVWLHVTGQPYTPLPFRTPVPYNLVRHPLYVGWGIAFWATPTMTLGHLLFASFMTVYMVAAVHVEERDLVAHFGEQYESYRARVPAFWPALRNGTRSTPQNSSAPSTLATVSTRGRDQ